MRILHQILFVAITILVVSCTALFTRMYGMKSIKPLNENAILISANEFHIPLEDVYELDTNYYHFLERLDTAKFKTEQKNHIQPLQALYFDSTGRLISFHINCNAGGIPNLKWNRGNYFATFPPATQTLPDTILNAESQMRYLISTSQTKQFSRDTLDYLVVVYWSRFMGRQSKRLVEVVQDNIKLSAGKRVKVIYVNNDNLFAQGENE